MVSSDYAVRAPAMYTQSIAVDCHHLQKQVKNTLSAIDLPPIGRSCKSGCRVHERVYTSKDGVGICLDATAELEYLYSCSKVADHKCYPTLLRSCIFEELEKFMIRAAIMSIG